MRESLVSLITSDQEIMCNILFQGQVEKLQRAERKEKKRLKKEKK